MIDACGGLALLLLFMDMVPSSGEWWNFASSTLSAIGAGLVLVAIGSYRVARRKREQQVDEQLAQLRQDCEKYREKHGYEIGDIKIAVAPLFTKAELAPPNYPSR